MNNNPKISVEIIPSPHKVKEYIHKEAYRKIRKWVGCVSRISFFVWKNFVGCMRLTLLGFWVSGAQWGFRELALFVSLDKGAHNGLVTRSMRSPSIYSPIGLSTRLLGPQQNLSIKQKAASSSGACASISMLWQ